MKYLLSLDLIEKLFRPPDNDCVINDPEEEAHVPVPVHGPEQPPEPHLAPHPDVTPTLVLCGRVTKCDSHDDVGPDVDLAVRVLDVGRRVLDNSNNLSCSHTENI